MQFNAEVETGSGGAVDAKHILKLKDGESATGVFQGEPYDYRQHWVGARSYKCTKPQCEHCDAQVRSAFRFRINFVVKEDGQYVAKIFEQGAKVYTQLKGLHAGDYRLDKTIVKIQRTGSTKDNTTYVIMPVRNCDVTLEMSQVLAKVKLHDLANDERMDAHGGASGNEDDIPF